MAERLPTTKPTPKQTNDTDTDVDVDDGGSPEHESPPSLTTMIRLIATLGGFLSRKSDSDPGVKVIWIGLQRVMDSATTIQALREGF